MSLPLGYLILGESRYTVRSVWWGPESFGQQREELSLPTPIVVSLEAGLPTLIEP